MIPPTPSTPPNPPASSHTVPLGQLASARSGDKGNHANIGVVARNADDFAFLRRQLTAEIRRHLDQLCEEGATQLFRPLKNNDMILGAVGILQFDVVAQRLKDEYKVECLFEPVSVATARWIECDDAKEMQRMRDKAYDNLALDQAGELVYIAPTRVNLELAMERYPNVRFQATREI